MHLLSYLIFKLLFISVENAHNSRLSKDFASIPAKVFLDLELCRFYIRKIFRCFKFLVV